MPKKKTQKAPAPKAPMTKRELSRYQKEKRQERMALGFVIVTVAAVVAVLLFGLWREILSRPGQVVARVNDSVITLGSLAEEAKYRAKTLDRQIELANQDYLQARAQAQNDANMSFLLQYYQQQLQQLQTERAQLADGTALLDDIIERELIRQEVIRRGQAVTAADVDAAIARQFQPQQQTSEPVTDTTTITGTVSPTATPVPPDAWKTNYQNLLTAYKISDGDFRRYSMEPIVWRERMQEILAADVPTTSYQIRARHILVPTEAEARDILALLRDVPTMKFEELAAARSTDESNKDKGGDLGWFGRGVMDPAFEAAAFALDVGQVSDVISTTYGFHIIKVEEKDPNHPLGESERNDAIMQAFDEWLTNAKAAAKIVRSFDTDKQNWLSKQIPPVP